MDEPTITEWPEREMRGAKRANITMDLGYYEQRSDGSYDYVSHVGTRDWFEGHGKDESCRFEGTWWDMICFARNVLASPNTQLAAPEFYRPEWKNDNYTGPTPYRYVAEPQQD
jgi:hypothetical protein